MDKFTTMLSRTPAPVTISALVSDLHALGVRPGMTLIAHSSLSSLGWVCGAALAVVRALVESVGAEGTVVMPTQSGILSDPRHWRNPPIPESWWDIVRQEMPPYNPRETPTGGMGRVPEVFRTMEGVIRSSHPKHSFAAFGAQAREIIEGHSLDFSFGEQSPLARLYERKASILLLGADYGSCTALHLAEYRADHPGKGLVREGAPILVNGERRWVEYDDVEEGDDFEEIGLAFEQETDYAVVGHVAQAQARLIPLSPLVDFGVEWMERNRKIMNEE